MDIDNIVNIDVEPSVDTSGEINVETEKVGPAGASAYQIAVKNGYIGTEEQWLASLKGDTGATGQNGVDGIDGKSLEFNWNNTNLGIRQEGQSEYQYQDLKGNVGPAGRDGVIQYTAGDNITIENNVISATGGDLSNYYTKSETDAEILGANIKGLHILNPSNNYMNHTYFIYFEAIGSPNWERLAPYMVPIMNDYIAHFNTNASYNMITVYIHDPIGNYRMVSRIENWSSSNKTPASMMTYDTYSNCYTRSILRFTYTDGVCIGATGSISTPSTTSGDFPLLKNNTFAYTPTQQTHPATKGYVDDAIASAITTTLNGGY